MTVLVCPLYCLYCDLISCNNMFLLYYISIMCVFVKAVVLVFVMHISKFSLKIVQNLH